MEIQARELIHSALFGHRKGAFTGATGDRKGAIREAEGGTLFLDEIGELLVEMQASLLRTLQTRTVQPLGADRPVRFDVKLVSATSGDLEAMAADGTFQGPLLARLDGYRIALPGLAQRREEILPILRALLPGREIGPDVAEALLVAPWPFNVRDLERVARTIRLARPNATSVSLADLHRSRVPEPLGPAPPGSAEIRAALEANDGVVKRAAEALGVQRTKLYRLMDAHDIPRSRG